MSVVGWWVTSALVIIIAVTIASALWGAWVYLLLILLVFVIPAGTLLARPRGKHQHHG